MAREVCNRVARFVAERDSYIKENRLLPLFCYADGNWSVDAKNDYVETFRRVIDCRYEIINRLRLFTQFFTGYSLRHARFGKGLPSFEPLTENTDSDIARRMKRPDSWVYRWMVLVSSIPQDYVFSPPRCLGEVGWDVSGVVVNHDTCVYQERVNLLYESGIFDSLKKRLFHKGSIRILEIGGGYGALAHKIKTLFPHSNYWLCDLPESLLFSALYLSLNRPDCKAGFGEEAPSGFTYLPNYMLDKLEGEFDLVINTLSFSELSEFQLRVYLEKIREIVKDGLLFEQNIDCRPFGFICAEEIIREYFDFSRSIQLANARRLSEGTSHIWAKEPLILESPMLTATFLSGANLNVATLIVALQDLWWWFKQRLKRLCLISRRLSVNLTALSC